MTSRELRGHFQRLGVPYPAPRLYLRVFKDEGEIEIWAGPRDPRQALRKIKTYPICATSGVLGPKRRQGDLQVPEGFYRLTRFRRHTRFHRSMRVSYPNRLDRLRGRRGGAILIHGKCCTIGCIPIEDGPIEELFRIARATRRRYPRRPLVVHIYPLRMNARGMLRLTGLGAGKPRLLAFWRDLEPAYRLFEASHHLPKVRITRAARYAVTPWK